jgi:hypothetical protein
MVKLFHYMAFVSWIVLLTLFSACNPLTNAAPSETANSTPTAIPTRIPADERAKGEVNAPVTLIEYGDYQ